MINFFTFLRACFIFMVTMSSCLINAQEVFINEIHYDNVRADVGEAIELTGPANSNLDGWSLVLYNGNGGAPYTTKTLSGTFEDTINGFGFISISFSSIQNGAPDGVALINDKNNVVQFLSYEGTFEAIGGPAKGLMSEDIGISEASNTPTGYSLQLTGSGITYRDFVWSPLPNTFGAINTGQALNGTVDPGEVFLKPIADVRSLPQGSQVKVKGILTVSDQFGGPAYIQDTTGGIAIFDKTVHGDTLFVIGDELEVTASLGQFNGMVQLVSVSVAKKISENNTITPITTTIAGLTDLEGQLVFIDAINFNSLGRLTTGNHSVSDTTGSIDIRIDNDVVGLVGRRKPDIATTLTGVVGSFNNTLQIYPRSELDLPGTTEFIIDPPAGEDISRDLTLEVANWNMEFFGSTLPRFGPSDIELQKKNALKVIDSLNADIIAVQEVSDINLLATAISENSGDQYAVICSNVYSRSFEPNTGTFPPQQLCFIYNTETVTILEDTVLFDKFYTAARTGQITDLNNYPTGNPQSFWSSGRLPYKITAEINIKGVRDTVSVVNVHAKSGRADSDVARKAYDFKVLKDTLDTYYATDKLIVLGDYNDDVDVSIGGGITPLQPFVTDIAQYDIVSNSFSFDDLSSTVGFNSVIDHTMITNELFEPYIEDSENLIDPRGFIENYANTTSDHLPSVTRFLFRSIAEPLVVQVPDSITLYQGFPNRSYEIISAKVSGGVAPYTYQWSNGSTDKEILVTLEDKGILTLKVMDASGLSSMVKRIQITVENVSCTKAWFSGVSMCFQNKTVCVPHFLAEFLLFKGYELGNCSNDEAIRRIIKATPNPFYQHLTLNFDYSQATDVSVEVFNYQGKTVYSKEFNIGAGISKKELAVSELHWGLYFIKIVDLNDPSYIQKLVVFKKG